MKTIIALIVLIALYLSFFFGEGILYNSFVEALSWLNNQHGSKAFIGALLLLTGIAIYLFTLERSDKEKEQQITDLLINNIKNQGVYATRMENTGFGEVHLKAMITFQDSAFLLQIKQNSNSDHETLLVDKAFLSWRELTKYIDVETHFELVDFLPKIGPEFQLSNKDAIAK